MATKKIASGRTPPDSTQWQQYPGGAGVFVDVDTSSAKFSGVPVYITSIGGNATHWATTGATSIYFPSTRGFRVFIRWSDGGTLNPATAHGYRWHINWIGMEL